MDATHVILCGLVWAQFRKREAGLELVRAIESADPELQSLAEVMLEQAGLCSGELVKDAIAKDSHTALETRLFSFQAANTAQAASDYWWLPLSSD
jgi:hypothetical protein